MTLRRHHLSIVMAVALTIATVVTTSCKPEANTMDSFVAVDTDGWAYGDTLVFVPELADSAATGRLSIAVCHDNRYRYANLWLEVVITDSLSTRTDTVNITLADQMGRWQGRGIGTDFQLSAPVKTDLTLRRPATFSVRHIMRDDRLAGIQRIGMIFKENQRDSSENNDHKTDSSVN